MVANTDSIQDFDFNKIIKIDQHTKDIEDLSKRITTLEERFGSNEKLADSLCEAWDKAVRMQELITKSFLKIVASNEDAKECITTLVNKIDRDWLKAYFKRIGFTFWSILVFVAGVAVTTIVGKWIVP